MIIRSRKEQRKANGVMRKFRPVPRNRRVNYVETTVYAIPPEIIAEHGLKAMPTNGPHKLWLRDRRLAADLAARDKRAGGRGWTMRVCYRRCAVCNRLLLDADAQEYLDRLRRPIEKWDTEDGPFCNIDCEIENHHRKRKVIPNGTRTEYPRKNRGRSW